MQEAALQQPLKPTTQFVRNQEEHWRYWRHQQTCTTIGPPKNLHRERAPSWRTHMHNAKIDPKHQHSSRRTRVRTTFANAHTKTHNSTTKNVEGIYRTLYTQNRAHACRITQLCSMDPINRANTEHLRSWRLWREKTRTQILGKGKSASTWQKDNNFAILTMKRNCEPEVVNTIELVKTAKEAYDKLKPNMKGKLWYEDERRQGRN